MRWRRRKERSLAYASEQPRERGTGEERKRLAAGKEGTKERKAGIEKGAIKEKKGKKKE